MKTRPLAERFWKHVDKNGPVHPVLGTQCWLWTGSRDTYGYGRVTDGGIVYSTHRLSWELHRGAVPEGLRVCHHCDNPTCVRDDHLFLGTNTDNMRDAAEKGRLPKQQITHCPSGHEYTAENTRVGRNTNGGIMRRCITCQRAYYKTWYAKNRATQVAAGVERARARRAKDPVGFRAQAAEYARRARARRKTVSHS